MAKHLAANAMTVLIVLCVALVGLVVVSIQSFSAPGPLKTAARVAIASGSNLKTASDRLLDAGAIDNASIFRIGARYRGLGGQVKFGEYEIPAGASMDQVLEIITSGRSLQYKVTVAEGLTSWEIVEALKASDVLVGEIDAVPAEGSLAPDTYFVNKGASRAKLIARMQAAQERILAEAWSKRDPDTPLSSPDEALVLASIIEKETGLSAERGKVGGVFVNRLRRSMRLQSDPTIIYGITKGQGPLDRPIRRSDITRPSDYNTYVIDRLPPGPIANPGRAAIIAALTPEETDAIYFVADGTGGHAFAKTLREHEKNVAAWRRIERQRQSE